MTVPMEYQHASEVFERFLVVLRDRAGLTTRHQTYTIAQAVLYALRQRMSVREGLRFADALPAILRAIFVSDWDIDEPLRPFDTLHALQDDVLAFRRDHSLATRDSVADVADALRHVMSAEAYAMMISRLPCAGQTLWPT
jgi:uncharacterized protein (DUF2267 family)